MTTGRWLEVRVAAGDGAWIAAARTRAERMCVRLRLRRRPRVRRGEETSGSGTGIWRGYLDVQARCWVNVKRFESAIETESGAERRETLRSWPVFGSLRAVWVFGGCVELRNGIETTSYNDRTARLERVGLAVGGRTCAVFEIETGLRRRLIMRWMNRHEPPGTQLSKLGLGRRSVLGLERRRASIYMGTGRLLVAGAWAGWRARRGARGRSRPVGARRSAGRGVSRPRCWRALGTRSRLPPSFTLAWEPTGASWLRFACPRLAEPVTSQR